MRRVPILLLLLLSISFASEVWTFRADGPLTTKPIVAGGYLIVGSYDGNVYALSQTSGTMQWKQSIGGEVLQPVNFGDAIVVPSSNGQVYLLDSAGKIKWRVNFTTVYGADASQQLIYVTTDKGLYAINSAGNVSLLYNATTNDTPSVLMTPPTVDGEYVVFSANDNLIVLKGRNVEWKKSVGATFWKSKPLVASAQVFVGATDNKLYEFDLADGLQRWAFETHGWVLSSAAYKSNKVIFGSNDGYIYALDALTGDLLWKKQTKEAVQSMPEFGQVAGRDVVFVGSNDRRMYVLDLESGEELWSFTAMDWVHSPKALGRMIFFGSHGKPSALFYAISTERACVIDSPMPESMVGYREVVISGRVFSEYGNPQIFIRFNQGNSEGEWIPLAPDGNNSWSYTMDPQNFDFGVITIECKISDNLGEERKPFTSMMLIRSEKIPKEKLIAIYPSTVEENKNFTIEVYDEKNVPVDNFQVVVGKKTYSGSKNISLSISPPGIYKILITKKGFFDSYVNVEVKPQFGLSAILLAIAVIAIIAGVYFFVLKRKPTAPAK